MWEHARLEADRQVALAKFVSERTEEGTRTYERAFDQRLTQVRALLDQTNDLLALEGGVFEKQPELITPARFLAAPPISEDDLNTLAGGSLKRRKRIEPELAARAAELFKAVRDPIRFPWVATQRHPTKVERNVALLWTAGIWAIEALRTGRRVESSQRQEAAVARGLRHVGWAQKAIRGIGSLDDLDRGTFTSEAALAGSKCDVPVRLRDGRLLAVECKVSNSATNSVKRLSREVGGKADLWRRAFGEQVIVAAVLSGVFRLKNLVDAQDRQRIALFWEHDLDPLFDFVESS